MMARRQAEHAGTGDGAPAVSVIVPERDAAGGAVVAGALPSVIAPPAGAVMLGVAAAGPLGYGLLLVAGAVAMGLGRRRPEAVLVPVVAATIHLAWAAGILRGRSGRRRPEPAAMSGLRVP